MEQNIIKSKMTQGAWQQNSMYEEPSTFTNGDGITMTHNSSYIKSGERVVGEAKMIKTNGGSFVDVHEEYLANAEAICSAVNNTYGNNYNPEKVGEMYNQLVQLQFDLMAMGKGENTPPSVKDYVNIRIPILNDLINSAKLNP